MAPKKNTSKFTINVFLTLSLLISSGLTADQKFALEPNDRTTIVGSDVILPCRILNRVGVLQWTRDEFALGDERRLIGYSRYSMSGAEEEGEYSLRIERTTLEDDAVFQCQVGAASEVKGIRSRSAKLTILVPPDQPMIVQGSFLKTTAGVDVELVCEAHGGKPAAELIWLDGDGTKITTDIEESKVLLSDGKRWNSALKLSLVPSAEHDGKRFTCRSENAALVQPMSTYIDLEVKYPPEVTHDINKEVFNEFDEVIVSCESQANPAEVVYKWFKNDTVFEGDFKETLTIPKVSRDYNDAAIICEVSNSVGTTRSTYMITVLYPPTVISSMENVAAEEGKEVTLVCEVEGNPQPEIFWTHDGSDTILEVGSELEIHNLTREHTGRYTCRAVAQGFKEISVDTWLFVKGPPKVHSDKIQYGVQGKTAKIECLVYSIPAPLKMNWTVNNLPLNLNHKRFKLTEEPLVDGIRQVLIIKDVKDEDFTTYNCSVTNEYGIDMMQIQLHQQKSLPLLIILAAVIVGIVVIVTVTVVVILCIRRKSLDKDEFSLPAKITKPVDTISSNGSDIKMEVHTNSSLSHNETTTDHWENTSDETQTGKTNEMYRYSSDYTDPMYQIKSETHNNNGYVPYVDYNRDYTPPLSQPHNISNNSGLYDSQNFHNGDYRHHNSYNPVSHSSVPHLHNSNYNTPTKALSPGLSNNMPPYIPQNIYITSPTNPTPLKPGTLATHV